LAWHLANGHTVLPKTLRKERMKENLDCTTVKLTEDEIKEIDGLNRNHRLLDPAKFDVLGFIPLFG